MSGLPSQIRTFFLPLGAVCLLLAVGGESLELALRYERLAIGDGGWLRLLTGHTVHLSWSHALLNLVGLGIVAGFFIRGPARSAGGLRLAFRSWPSTRACG